jgi:hypothetical protein
VHNNNSFIRLYEVKTNFDSNLYKATLEEGINFKKPSYPTFLKFVGGLSQHENWGRWTDANQGGAVLLGFKDPLPNRFSLELVAQSHPSNVGKATLIRVGQQEKIININDNNTQFSLDFETDGNIDLIEIIPPNFATENLLSSAAQDPRRIGIGLVEVKIKTLAFVVFRFRRSDPLQRSQQSLVRPLACQRSRLTGRCSLYLTQLENRWQYEILVHRSANAAATSENLPRPG